jgi:hypothetical protein
VSATRRVGCVLALILNGLPAWTASVTFTPRELFRVPFGTTRETVSAKIEGGNLIIPRGFTMDEDGHFYIYDSNNHRIARFSAHGRFEMEFRYVPTAEQVFAHPDSRQNLWMLVSDHARGTYYGIFDAHGKRVRDALFSRFNHFQLHVEDDYTLHAILSSDWDPAIQTYFFDEGALRLKKLDVARPPDQHHQVRKSGHVYFVDAMPGASAEPAGHSARIRDEVHHGVADIQGVVIYATPAGEIYTRVGSREIRVYEVDGTLRGKIMLEGLRSACAAIRFDSDGNMYELDGIPDLTNEQVTPANAEADREDLRYTASMPGMRLIQWQRR